MENYIILQPDNQLLAFALGVGSLVVFYLVDKFLLRKGGT